MKQQVINGLKVIVIGLILSAGISYAGNWVAPAGPPPGNNAQGPINVGTTGQTKAGGLGVQHFIAWDNAAFARDVRVKDIFNPGASGDLYVQKLANSTGEHVCADSEGKLFLCGVTPPPVPGVKTQTYEINSSGTQITYGDCANCTATEFVTPQNITSGTPITIEINGGGGGGGGGLGYPYGFSSAPSPCSASGFPPGTVNDTGPSVKRCQFNAGGGGGGGGARSIYTGISTQPGLYFSVDVGRGGSGGNRRGYGFIATNFTNTSGLAGSIASALAGSSGEESKVNGPVVGASAPLVARAAGGSGGLGGSSYPPGSLPSVVNANGGVGGNSGTGNISNGQIGSTGKLMVLPYVIDVSTGDFTGYLSQVWQNTGVGSGGSSGNGSSGGTGGVGFTSCQSGALGGGGGGGGGVPSPLDTNSGNGCSGGHGKIIFSWTE
jgi:hypothetical protein